MSELGEDDKRVTWRSVAADLAGTIQRSTGPLTFLIGAGASLSSGAPSTKQVAKAFELATKGRFGAVPTRDLLHLIPESEKQDILAPLFADVSPYIGYRCLAALGRHRRVYVLNLNWDNAAAAACDELKVPHVAFDVLDRKRQSLIDKLPTGSGVVVVHLHGLLGEKCRFEVQQTLKFDQKERIFIERNFLSHTLIVIGASIVYDTDLQDLFLVRKNGGSQGQRASQWFFGRPDVPAQLDASRRAEFSSGVLNYCCGADINFDELMVRLLSAVLRADWEKLRQNRQAVGLPTFDALIWPEAPLLRPLLAGRMVALLGPPRLGKSVVAHFLAYLHAMWNAPAQARLDELPIKTVDGPAEAVGALAGFQADECSIYIIENPFSFGKWTEINLAFWDALQRASAIDSSSRIVLTSRLGSWPGNGALKGEIAITKSAFATHDWFSRDTLCAYARNTSPDRLDLPDRIATGEICTPAHLADALLGIKRIIAYRDLETANSEIEDKLRLLEQDQQLAWLCCILRLQDFCPETLDEHDINQWLQSPVDDVPFHGAVLHRFQFDSRGRLRLAHDTDREATDFYLQANRRAIFDKLKLGPNGGRPLVDAFRVWEVLAAAANRDWITVSSEPRALLRRCAPQLLTVIDGHSPMLERIANLTYDAWEIKDLSSELVRLWHQFRSVPAAQSLLSAILADRGTFGTYAVFEACLYMRLAVSDDLWQQVYASFDHLVDQPTAECELALAVDALTWRPPPKRYEKPSWARRYLELGKPGDARRALVRFLAGYHANGLQNLDYDDMIRDDRTRSWTAEQAEFGAWLVRWHFIHQSQARAQFMRQPWVDRDFLGRALNPTLIEHSLTPAYRLLQSLLDFPEQAGWAFFLGCNLPAIGYRFDQEGKRLMEKALELALPRSSGVIAAILTYHTASEYRVGLTEYFAQSENREALLDAMRDGLLIDGVYLRPPYFVVNRDPISCYRDTGLAWENIKQALPPADLLTTEGNLNLRGLVNSLRSRLSGLQPALLRRGERVVAQVEAGDLRLLDAAAAARTPSRHGSAEFNGDQYALLLNRAANLMDLDQLSLFG